MRFLTKTAFFPLWDQSFMLITSGGKEFSIVNTLLNRMTVSSSTSARKVNLMGKTTELPNTINQSNQQQPNIFQQAKLLNNLGIRYLLENDLQKANNCLHEACDIYYRAMDDANLDNTQSLSIKSELADTLISFAALQQQSGRYEEAILTSQKALHTQMEVVGKSYHPSYWKYYANLALAYLTVNMYKEALAIYELRPQVINLTNARLFNKSFIDEGVINQSVISMLDSKSELSIKLLENYIQKMPGGFSNDINLAFANFNLSSLYFGQGQGEKALYHFSKANEIFNKVLKSDHPLRIQLDDKINPIDFFTLAKSEIAPTTGM